MEKKGHDRRAWALLLLALVPVLGMIASASVFWVRDSRSLDRLNSESERVEAAADIARLSKGLARVGDFAFVTSGDLEVRQEATSSLASTTALSSSLRSSPFTRSNVLTEPEELLDTVDDLLSQVVPGERPPNGWEGRMRGVELELRDAWITAEFSFGDATLAAEAELMRSLGTYVGAWRAERATVVNAVEGGAELTLFEVMRSQRDDRADRYQTVDFQAGRLSKDLGLVTTRSDLASGAAARARAELSAGDFDLGAWLLDFERIEVAALSDIEVLVAAIRGQIEEEVSDLSTQRLLTAGALAILTLLAMLLILVTRSEVRHRRRVEKAHGAALSELAGQAETDALTGLLNRRGVEAKLQALCAGAGTDDEVVIIYIDLDRFKPVNDVWGHEVGDRVLRRSAQRVQDELPADFDLVRFGGDEFVAFGYLNETSPVGAEQLATQFIRAIRQPMEIDRRRIEISATAGIAVGDAASKVDELLLEADAALIRAKKHSRGSAVVYLRNSNQDTALVRAFPKAIIAGEIFCHFQPAYAVGTGRCVAIEALARWERADGTWISPAEFVLLAESYGLMSRLTEVVVRNVAQLQAQPGLPADCRVWMNLSPVELDTMDFSSRFIKLCAQHGIDFSRFGIEITETAAIRDPVELAAHLAKIRSVGIHVAIDDFGNGFSPLGYLRKLPIDVLKLDRSLVEEIHKQPAQQSIVTGVIGMMKELGIEVVAEGVEEIEEIRWLAAAGAPVVQGYFYSKPMSGADLLEFIAPRDAQLPTSPRRLLGAASAQRMQQLADSSAQRTPQLADSSAQRMQQLADSSAPRSA